MAGRNTKRERPAEGSAEADAKESHCTPQIVIDWALEVFDGGIDLDPASNPNSIVPATLSIWLPKWANGYREPDLASVGVLVGDGLKVSWRFSLPRTTNVFGNPPYGRGHNGPWAAKAAREAREERDLPPACLFFLVPGVPARKWWRPYRPASHGGASSGVCLLEERVKFRGAEHGADFDNAAVYFGPYPERFRKVMDGKGWVIT